MAFNAGSIEATLTLNRNPFQEGLKLAKAEAQKFEKNKYEVTLGTKIQEGTFTAFKKRLEAFAKKTYEAKIKTVVDKSSMTTLITELKALEKKKWELKLGFQVNEAQLLAARKAVEKFAEMNKTAKAKVDVDRAKFDKLVKDLRAFGKIRVTARASVRVNDAALRRLEERLRRFGNSRSTATADIDTSGMSGGFGRTRILIMAILALLPMIGSAIVAIIGLVGALTSAFVVAGAAVGAWGLVAVPVFKKIQEAVEAGQGAINKLPPGLKEAANALKGLNTEYEALQKRTQGGVGYAMAAGFRAAATVLKTLDPIINATSKALESLANQANKYFQGPHWAMFVSFVSSNLGPVLQWLFDIVVNLTRAVMNIAIAFMPLAQMVLPAIAKGIGEFADWILKISGTQEFQDWLRLAAKSLEAFWNWIVAVVRFLFNLSTALAPLGNLMFKFWTAVSDGLSAIPPEMLAAIAAGLAAIFTAILLGASGPVAIVVGVIIGLAAAFTSLYESSKPFKDAVDGIANSLKTWLIPVLQDVNTAIETKIKPAWDRFVGAVRDNVLPVLETLWKAFQEKVLPVLGDIVKMIFDDLIPAFLDFWTAIQPVVGWLLEVVGGTLVDSFQALGRIIQGALEVITGVFKMFTGLLTGDWTKFWEGLKQVGEGILRAILAFFGVSLDEFYAWIQGWGQSISTWWNGLWTDISKFFEDTWNGIVDFFTKTIPQMWDDLVNGAKKAVDDVGKWFADLPKNIGYALGYALGTIVKWGIGIKDAVVKAFEATMQWFEDLPENIGKFFDDAGEWLKTEGKAILDGLYNGIKEAGDAVDQWFKDLPGRIGQFFSDAGTWLETTGGDILTGLYNGIKTAGDAVDTFFVELPGKIGGFFSDAGNWLLKTGEDILNGLLTGLGNIATTIGGWISDFCNSFVQGFKDALGIASPSTIFATIGTDIIQGMINGVQSMWAAITTFFTNLWQTLVEIAQNVFSTVITVVTNIVNNIRTGIENFITGVKTIWNAFWDAVLKVATDIWNAIKSAVQTGLTTIENAVRDATTKIGQAWRAVANFFREPINWVINVVLNDGILGAWNTVMGWIGAPGLSAGRIPSIPAFASGGQIMGPGSGTSDSILAAVSNGEYVVKAKVARQTRHFLDALNNEQPEAMQAVGARAHGGLSVAYPRFAAGGSVEAGQAFAAAQNGKPYIWGGVGPAGYDCSGFMSAITNVLLGRGPHSRVGTTGSAPWPGFTPGLTSAFGIGYFKGNPGHMAGTLGGVNVESGGSPSRTKYGAGAAGADSGQFSGHMSLPQVGGAFIGGGNTVETVSWWSLIGKLVTDLFKKLIPTMIPGMSGPMVDSMIGASKAAVEAALAAIEKKLTEMMTQIVKDVTGAIVSFVGTVGAGIADLLGLGGAPAGPPAPGGTTVSGTFDNGGVLLPGQTLANNYTGQREFVNTPKQVERLFNAGHDLGKDAQAEQDRLQALITAQANDRIASKLDALLEMLERRGAGATINMSTNATDPQEAARAVVLGLRLT